MGGPPPEQSLPFCNISDILIVENCPLAVKKCQSVDNCQKLCISNLKFKVQKIMSIIVDKCEISINVDKSLKILKNVTNHSQWGPYKVY